MNRLPDNLFRKDLNLEKRWWHRLAKIFFIILSIFVLIGSSFGFYSAEENNARQYKIVRNFKDFLEIQQKNLLNEGELNDNGCPINQKGFNFRCLGRILAPESFLSQHGAGILWDNDGIGKPSLDSFILSDYSLGCLNRNGVPKYLSEDSFKNDITCDQKTGLSCYVPKSICGGITSNIVKYTKYDYEVKYGLYNYLPIATKTLGVFLGWVLLTHLIYYKALLYVIFGGKRHTDHP